MTMQTVAVALTKMKKKIANHKENNKQRHKAKTK